MTSRHSILFRTMLFIISVALSLLTQSSCNRFATPLPETNYTYPPQLSNTEQIDRSKVVSMAQSYLGYKESDGTHKEIVDLYNSHLPLARNYKVQYTDEWCAVFVSVVAIRCEMTHIIPTECGCERQIQLFRQLGRWEERDEYAPLPGDIIYYHTKHRDENDCGDWSDHVGIVISCAGGHIKVVEGNYSGSVRYRTIPIDDVTIRGFAIPEYGTDFE